MKTTWAFAFATALLAQTTPPAQKPDPPQTSRAVFRSAVDVVQLNAVVTDAKGKPVTDLTQDEFQILDEDRPQTIAAFERVTIPASHRTIDSSIAATAPPADVATNPPPARAFVFVIDDGTIEPDRIVPVKTAMKQFLETMSPEDRMAIVFTRRSDLGQDFTMDVSRLTRAVQNITAAVRDTNAPIGGAADARAARVTLEDVIRTLSEAPETRRAIVFVTGGLPTCASLSAGLADLNSGAGLDCMLSAGGQTAWLSEGGLQSLIDRAQDADVPIYVIDPNGLRAPSLGFSGRDQTPEGRMLVDQLNANKQNFGRTLAENTGGLAFVNTSIYQAADAVLLDNSTYYVLGYSPSSLGAGDKLHEVRVKVTRPGVRVRAWKRYPANTKAPVTADPAAHLLAAVADAETHGALALRAFAAPVLPGANGTATIIRIDVAYPAADTRADDTLNVAFMAVNSDGKITKSESRSLQLPTSKMPPGATTVSLDDTLDLPAGQWTLRVGVSSRALGTTGTVHLPVEVPTFTGAAVAATPLVIGYADKDPALVGRPETIAPLIPLQPTTQREFSRATRLRVFTRVFATSLDSVKTELTLKRGTEVVRTTTLRTTPASAPGATDCDTTVTLRDLKPGAYVLEFTAKSGRDQVVRAVGITVK